MFIFEKTDMIKRGKSNMYKFTKDCMTGIAMVDEEHSQLFDTINQAIILSDEEGNLSSEVKSLLLVLKQYTETHFEHEEEYMKEINDPELDRQKREHQAFKEKLEGFPLEKLEHSDGKQLLKELLEYLSRWLYHHILGSDIMIGKLGAVHNKAKSQPDNPFEFTEKYHTGIVIVDEEHATLFDIIRETNDLISEELLHDKYDRIVEILGELRDYTIYHFQDEEKYMTSIGYSGLEAQKCAHQAFVDRLNEINLDEVDENQQEYLEELVEFLRSWLINHILKMDKLIPVEG